MMRSMYSGVAGLKVHQTKMDVVGNNISNVNTTGYKGSRVNFKEMLSQTLQGAQAPQGDRGGLNPRQIGLGVSVGSIDTNMEQGNLQSTGSGTDLAIQGNGFFVVNDGQQNLYTRSGAMSLDEEGSLVNSSTGYNVRGWMAEDDGKINTNKSMEDIKIPIGKTMTGEKTTLTQFGGNLDGRVLGGESRIATIDIYDSLGEKHTMSIDFERRLGGAPEGSISLASETLTAVLNDDTSASGLDTDQMKKLNGLNIEFGEDTGAAADASYEPTTNTVTVTGDWSDEGAGYPSLSQMTSVINNAIETELTTASQSWPSESLDSLNFSGTYDDTVAEKLIDAPSISLESSANTWDWEVSEVTDADVTSIQGSGTISFNNDGTYDTMTPNTEVTFNPVGSATAANEIKLDLEKMTQSAADYSVDGINANGYEMGSLESFNIDNAGIINGTFSNGLSQPLGQLAVANFSNPSGMTKEGDTLFAESQNSGMAQIGLAGNGGRGSISSGSLEMSNVDLSKQFTEMITTQRGFQANSKAITTTDQMLQELVNLKR